MQASVGKRSGRRAVVGVAAIALALVAGACGSKKSSSTTEAPATSAAPASTEAPATSAAPASTEAAKADIMSEAARIAKLAKDGLVFAAADSGTLSTDIVAQTGWLGPDSTPTPPKGKKLDIIICAPGTACEVAANYAKEAAEKIGWTAEIVPGAGTPESFNQAFDTAIAGKPDVIMSMAIPDVAVGPSLAKAKAAGIVTISVADVPAAAGADAYDAYVSYRMPLMHQINAYNIIDESKGTANVILINDSEFPNLVESNNQFKRVMAECTGCKVTVVDWLITDALDPVKADAVVTAALQANPDATHVVMPYSIGISSVAESIRKAGKSDAIKLYTKDGDEVGLGAIAGGSAWGDAGVSLEWVAYAGVDEAIRGVTGSPFLGAEKLGLGVHLFTKENVPADGKADWSKPVDYKAQYLKLWGVS